MIGHWRYTFSGKYSPFSGTLSLLAIILTWHGSNNFFCFPFQALRALAREGAVGYALHWSLHVGGGRELRPVGGWRHNSLFVIVCSQYDRARDYETTWPLKTAPTTRSGTVYWFVLCQKENPTDCLLLKKPIKVNLTKQIETAADFKHCEVARIILKIKSSDIVKEVACTNTLWCA